MACAGHSGAASATSFCCAFALSLAIAFVNHILTACVALALAFILFAFFGRSLKDSAHIFLLANFFIFLVWLTVPWTTPGETVHEIWRIEISRQGIELATLVTLKANAIILVFLAIMAGMTPMMLGLAFAQMRISHKLALMLVFSGTHIEILHREWKILKESSAIRGFYGKCSFHAWKTYGAMLAFLLVRASDKADALHEALLLKNFDGKFPVCCPWRLCKMDYLLIFSAISGIFLLSFLEFHFYAS